MKSKFLVLCACVAMAGCGEDLFGDTDAGVDAGTAAYTFSAGTFAVTNAISPGSDQCGLLASYTDPAKKIGITMSGSTLTFNLANDSAAPADSMPMAVKTDNEIAQPTEANYTVAYGTTCVVRVKRTVVGNVVKNDTAALTLSFSVATETGNCSTGTSFAAVPCSSSYQFTATKQP